MAISILHITVGLTPRTRRLSTPRLIKKENILRPSKARQLCRKTIWNQQPGWDAPRQKKIKQKHQPFTHLRPARQVPKPVPAQRMYGLRSKHQRGSMTATIISDHNWVKWSQKARLAKKYRLWSELVLVNHLAHFFGDCGSISISSWYRRLQAPMLMLTHHTRSKTEIVRQKMDIPNQGWKVSFYYKRYLLRVYINFGRVSYLFLHLWPSKNRINKSEQLWRWTFLEIPSDQNSWVWMIQVSAWTKTCSMLSPANWCLVTTRGLVLFHDLSKHIHSQKWFAPFDGQHNGAHQIVDFGKNPYHKTQYLQTSGSSSRHFRPNTISQDTNPQ